MRRPLSRVVLRLLLLGACATATDARGCGWTGGAPAAVGAGAVDNEAADARATSEPSGSPFLGSEASSPASDPPRLASDRALPESEPPLLALDSLPAALDPPVLASDPPGSDETPTAPEKPRGFASRFLRNEAYLFTRWIPSESKRPAFAAPILGSGLFYIGQGGGGSSSIDERISRWAMARQSRGGDLVSNAFVTYGGPSAAILVIGGVWGTAHLRGNLRLERTASLAAEAWLHTALWVGAMKIVTARTRPARDGPGTFFDYHPARGQKNDAFPSGHAAVGFAVATVFSREYGEHRWVPWVTYSGASLVALARLYGGQHWPSDLVIGAVMGESLGRMVVMRDAGPSAGGPPPACRRERAPKIEPVIDPVSRTAGVTIAIPVGPWAASGGCFDAGR